MIRSLRRKFVLINMLLVFLVLLIVFTAILVSSWENDKRESDMALTSTLQRAEFGIKRPAMDLTNKPGQQQQHGLENDLMNFRSSCPSFWVEVSESGEILSVNSDSETVTSELAEEAYSLAKSQSDEFLWSLSLRARAGQLADGTTRYAFCDISAQLSSLQDLLLSSLLIGLGGLVLFFFVSLFLCSIALRPLKKAWEEQRRFVADASHELKTPLTVMLANTDILLAHPEKTVGEQAHWIENTRDEGNRMKKLVGDLLFLAKSDEGRQDDFLPFDLSEAVTEALLPFEAVAFEKNVRFENELASPLPFRGAKDRIEQLVGVLCDNAFKYEPEGGLVRVTLTDTKDRLTLRVFNAGTYLPPSERAHLFDRFWRSDSSRARSDGGYGLGLAIAQSIAQSHLGTISVESEEGKGCTFLVSFPAGGVKA